MISDKNDSKDDFEIVNDRIDPKDISLFLKNVANLDTAAYKEYLSKTISESNSHDISATKNYLQKIMPKQRRLPRNAVLMRLMLTY